MSEQTQLYTRFYVLYLWRDLFMRSTHANRDRERVETWALGAELMGILMAGPPPTGFHHSVWNTANALTNQIEYGSEAQHSITATLRFHRSQRELGIALGGLCGWAPRGFQADRGAWLSPGGRTPAEVARFDWFIHPVNASSALWHGSGQDDHRL